MKKTESKKEKSAKETRYIEATGRRKTAVARVRLWTKGKKELLVNNKPYENYFSTFELQQVAKSALSKMKSLDRFRISVRVKGGGLHSQAEAVRHGVSRVLVIFNPDYKKRLRKAGYLTRDPRMRERKKFGLKRARRAPQWQKR
ncbi:30S ribosomal protein S9 [Parcubacteria bacterium DG_74_2]|nr:MAG: 30S ribosomal protein S9 [Parcubacteria bacterium DG_74_2]